MPCLSWDGEQHDLSAVHTLTIGWVLTHTAHVPNPHHNPQHNDILCLACRASTAASTQCTA